MPNKQPDLFKFWNELKRRKVAKATLVYIAVAWAILEASDTIFPKLGLPEWTVTFVLLLLIIIFILVIILTWVYDITPEGIKVTESVKEEPKKKEKQPDESELRDSGGSPETGLDDADTQYEIKTQERSLKRVTEKADLSGSFWPGGLRKFILPILIIVLVVVILIFKQRLTQVIGHDDPDRERAKLHVENAVSFFNTGDYESAKAEVELALASDPKYSYAWSSLAAVSVKQGDLNKAVMETIQAVKFDSTNSQAAYNMAFALDDKKDYQQAVKWYKTAIAIDARYKKDSTLIPAYSALGRLYNALNQPIDAILILSEAKEKYPESTYIYLVYKNLGNAFLLQEQSDSALKYLELSREMKQDETETNLFLARACEAAGKWTKSIEIWQNYIELETDTAKINEAKKHQKEIAIRQLQEIIK